MIEGGKLFMQVVDTRSSITIAFEDVVRKQCFRYDDTVYVKISGTQAFRFDCAEVEDFTPTTNVEIVSTKIVITG